MAEFVTIKLKTGVDLIAIVSHNADDSITVENPIQIEVDPVHGFFAKSWLLLARSNFVTINKEDILFFDDASDKAIYYYEEFMEKLGKSFREEERVDRQIDDDEMSDLEDMFMSLLESRMSTKH